MIASILGRTETVRLLLDYGADIDILHKVRFYMLTAFVNFIR